MTNKQSHIMSEINEINWLVERAKGKFGIITTAATNVSLQGKAWDGEFGVYDDSQLPQLIKLTTNIHQTKSIIIAQLFHGIRSPQKITGTIPISCSEIDCNESETGKSEAYRKRY